MQELQGWFASYRAKHVMFVADACYSGLAISTRAAGLSAGALDYLAPLNPSGLRQTHRH
jgi:hypothetical protein